MNLNWFANILVHHPFIILSAVGVFSGTCLIIPFMVKTMTFPHFQDPQLGFSTRGTIISNRLTAWTNLIKSTKPSGELTRNPKEYLHHQNRSLSLSLKYQEPKKMGKRKKNKNRDKVEYGNLTPAKVTNTSDTEIDIDRWKMIQNLSTNNYQKIQTKTESYFCGSPDDKYAHLVITAEDNQDLFTLENMLAMCHLEQKLANLNHYSDLCIQNSYFKKKCCSPWSIPNYISIINNRESCLDIQEEDIDRTKNILKMCASHYHTFKLSYDCLKTSPYCDAPLECIRHDAVFNILNYLASTSFLPTNTSQDVNDTTDSQLKEAMIFLPLACSTAILPYYYEIDKLNLQDDNLKIVAMDFGVKTALFDECLVRDTWLMGLEALFIFVCIWFYTHSLFLTIITIILVLFSLAIAYFIYILVLEIHFFPFMNLLAIVVAIGIGSDDAFIFCKIWQIHKHSQDCSLQKMMTDTLHHTSIAMFVTALTTAVAFFGSYISSVTAISCFSIFAGIAVIANYFLMMTWFPACLIIWEKSCLSNPDFYRSLWICYQRWCCPIIPWNMTSTRLGIVKTVWCNKEKWLLETVLKLKYVWFFILLLLGILSGFIVFVYPKLQLPDSTDFQLFASSHPFEQYDFIYRHKFWFNNPEKLGYGDYKLPLRFVWGVLPVDNGNRLNPSDKGSLVLDETFEISEPASQEWLKNFCRNLRQQPFYQSTMGPLLLNCFIETFMNSMQRKCFDDFRNKNVTPCCETSTFPFERDIFRECVVDEIAELYETPVDILGNSDAGPKFSRDQTPTIKAIVVEYDSSYSYTMSYEIMHEFYTMVETWMQNELKTAPVALKNGWFVSELEFYDLQRELSTSTETAVLMSMVSALIVLMISTLNLLTSLYAIITITCSIFVTMAVLVVLGWKLNILESTAVSIAIGLTVDFSLHYSVNYRLSPEEMGDRESATRFALTYMSGPAFMAALTTGAAGAFMLPSIILPYIQIGIFLVLVMSISWIYATFFLGSMLAIMGPNKNCAQLSYSKLASCFLKVKRVQERSQQIPSSIPDSHELESLNLGKRERSTPKPLRRSLSAGVRFTPIKHVFTDQSPSGTSAITIIMADDN